MLDLKCDKCDSCYKVKDEFAGKHLRCKKCGAVILVQKPAQTDECMPDFNTLFMALAEEELHAPTLEDSMMGV